MFGPQDWATRPRARQNRQQKCLFAGTSRDGSDGTRTRDLRRDRPLSLRRRCPTMGTHAWLDAAPGPCPRTRGLRRSSPLAVCCPVSCRPRCPKFAIDFVNDFVRGEGGRPQGPATPSARRAQRRGGDHRRHPLNRSRRPLSPVAEPRRIFAVVRSSSAGGVTGRVDMVPFDDKVECAFTRVIGNGEPEEPPHNQSSCSPRPGRTTAGDGSGCTGAARLSRRSGRLFLDAPYFVCRACAGVRYSSQTHPKPRHVQRVERAKAIR